MTIGTKKAAGAAGGRRAARAARACRRAPRSTRSWTRSIPTPAGRSRPGSRTWVTASCGAGGPERRARQPARNVGRRGRATSRSCSMPSRARCAGVVKNGGLVFDALSRNQRQLSALVRESEHRLQRHPARAPGLRRHLGDPADLPRGVAADPVAAAALRARTPTRWWCSSSPPSRSCGPTLQDLRRAVAGPAALLRQLRPLHRPRAALAARHARDHRRGCGRPSAPLSPLLSEVNPLLDYVSFNQHQVTDFLSHFSLRQRGARDSRRTIRARLGHVTRLFSPTGPDTPGLLAHRRPQNRGNAYLAAAGLRPARGRADGHPARPGTATTRVGRHEPATRREPASLPQPGGREGSTSRATRSSTRSCSGSSTCRAEASTVRGWWRPADRAQLLSRGCGAST